MAGNDQEGHFEAYLGATGCGKTTAAWKRIAKMPAKAKRRVFVWSPKEKKDNYAGKFRGAVRVNRVADAAAIIARAGRSGPFCIVFVPTLDYKADRKMFDFVCRMLVEAEDVLFLVEEIHSVTDAANAARGWRLVNFIGRASGLWVYGMSQRPASVDKAFLGSLSFLHVGRLPNPPDQAVAAEFLGVGRNEVAALVEYQAIQRDMTRGKIIRAA